MINRQSLRSGSDLPTMAQALLAGLANNQDDATGQALVDELAQLPAEKIITIAERLRASAALQDWRRRHNTNNDLLLIFHGNGYIREAALNAIDRPLPGPFFVAAVAYRLNDWVEEVRAAAKVCLKRVLGISDPQFVVDASVYLIHQMWLWRRAGSYVNVLVEELSKPAIMEGLAKRLSTSTTGPLARTLRNALRFEAMDLHLPVLAKHALSPAIRSVAHETLIDGRARWLDGHQQEWIDKSMSLHRRVPRYSYRPLTVAADLGSQIQFASEDRVAIVRRLAAQKLIEHRHNLPPMRTLALSLTQDRSASVRERAEFYLLRHAN